ncbi:MAG: hypothetical protein RMA76_10875 [Deltaproteobacteria bacterium]|jgi:hypothetical protein
MSEETEERLEDVFAEDDDEMFRRRERYRPVIADIVKKAIENTVGQVQNTQTAGRDAISYLLQQGERGKEQAVRVIAKEVGDFLRATDISSEAVKILTQLRVEVNASVSFKPTGDGRAVKPEVDAGSKVSVRDPSGRDVLEEQPEDLEPDGDATTDLSASGRPHDGEGH